MQPTLNIDRPQRNPYREMNETDTDSRERETHEDEAVTARPDRPFGGLSPAEAGRRSAEQRRERKAAHEAAADLDRLSVSSRVSTAIARQMSYADITAVIRALQGKAKEGHIQAIRELRSWLALAGIDAGAEDGDALSWDAMSAEQRGAARAQLQRELAEIEEGAASE